MLMRIIQKIKKLHTSHSSVFNLNYFTQRRFFTSKNKTMNPSKYTAIAVVITCLTTICAPPSTFLFSSNFNYKDLIIIKKPRE